MNVAVVQPIFESLAIFAWCVLSTVIADRPRESAAPESVAAKKGERVMRTLQGAVLTNNAERYVSAFSEEQQAEIRPKVAGVLAPAPCKYQLAMSFKNEVVSASSYEAQLRVKVLITNRCTSKYEESLEIALITIAPKAESDDGRFFSKPSGDPAEQDWEITKWETESVVPYDRSKDR